MMIIDLLNTASIEDSRYWVVLGGGGEHCRQLCYKLLYFAQRTRTAHFVFGILAMLLQIVNVSKMKPAM